MSFLIMSINIIIKYFMILTTIGIISSQSVLASLKDTGNDTCIPCDDWQHTNVFLISHGYTYDFKMDNLSGLSICFKKNINIYIEYNSLFTEGLYPEFKAWNNAGLIEDFEFYYFSIYAINFTGIIIHRNGLIRELWNLYGYCSILKIHSPDYD